MNEEQLRAWLLQADEGLPAAPEGLAARLRAKRSARRRNAALAGALALAMVGGGAAFVLSNHAARRPAEIAQVAADPAKAAAEARVLLAETDALVARIAAIEIPVPTRRKPQSLPAEIRRELADARAAALLAWHAERRLNFAGDKADALARFRQIVELFPETPAGLAAVSQVELLSKEVM